MMTGDGLRERRDIARDLDADTCGFLARRSVDVETGDMPSGVDKIFREGAAHDAEADNADAAFLAFLRHHDDPGRIDACAGILQRTTGNRSRVNPDGGW